MRIALGVEYDGAGFNGWQRQHGVRTVQAELEAALARVANQPVAVTCAGRTDSGVHALYQVVHFDTPALRTARSWVLGANSNLPRDVAVLWAREVADDFHARFSARSRAYAYLICNRATRPGLWHGRVTWDYRPLDVERMAEAARHWLGEHDFSSFRAKGCQSRHPVRTVYRCEVERRDDVVVLRVEANAFLQHMVRNFAGVLTEIGCGARAPEWAAEVLSYRERERGGVTAPPDGLYLRAVSYPPGFDLPPPPRAVPLPVSYHGYSF
ncbi:MAG: tRNA pseudouridine(38-40) synthase TruA [Gammaproteobacteria bacterium]|nr:tRNA pseudouridine(38-40) synthase TruA [Gammaproteobacteria bacterium]MCP5201630.1 tRNA pseudouridine(38-40) synthase TruA [Gammaproteobacteria bacterium]